MDNKELIAEYPFLLPRNVFTDKVSDDYDYHYTLLDDMPRGWKKAFGEQLCRELKEALVEDDVLEDYRIMQIKEKFGQLRWYGNWESPRIYKVLDKYESLSEHTCIECGGEGTMRNDNWISPYCDDCYRKYKERLTQRINCAKMKG